MFIRTLIYSKVIYIFFTKVVVSALLNKISCSEVHLVVKPVLTHIEYLYFYI